MADDLRKLITDAETLGFEYHGQKHGGGHLQFVHTLTGTRIIASSTPSCYSAWKNTRQDMERVAGYKLPRENRARYTFKKVARLDVRQSVTEIKSAETVDIMVARASVIRDSFRQLAANPTRANVQRARRLLDDFEDIRAQLADHHRVIDPIY